MNNEQLTMNNGRLLFESFDF